ncbi:olee1-like protein [Mercurialis annua]|uniref:olee1-like protein n=1 Tax=Mercurialis annua TaxID=3986 RepID=UPI002160FD27|nr:olee1-like protein [Mercurialis annua]
MAKSINNIIFLASAICFLSFLGLAYGNSHFVVEGKIYCDTCRIQFITKLTTYLKGAKVRLECMEREGGAITFSAEAETDATGAYQIPVVGDHEEEICKITLLSSPDADCNEIKKDPWAKKAAQITLTSNNGIASSVRAANPIGFMKKQALPECIGVLRDMGFNAHGVMP